MGVWRLIAQGKRESKRCLVVVRGGINRPIRRLHGQLHPTWKGQRVRERKRVREY